MNETIKTILEKYGFGTTFYSDDVLKSFNSAIIEICEEQKKEFNTVLYYWCEENDMIHYDIIYEKCKNIAE